MHPPRRRAWRRSAGPVAGAQHRVLLQNVGRHRKLGQPRRFRTCVPVSGARPPHKAMRRNIGDALNILVQIERRQRRRSKTEVLPINHDDEVEDRYHVSLAPPQSVHERGFRRACLGSRQRRKMMLRRRSPFPPARQTQPGLLRRTGIAGGGTRGDPDRAVGGTEHAHYLPKNRSGMVERSPGHAVR